MQGKCSEKDLKKHKKFAKLVNKWYNINIVLKEKVNMKKQEIEWEIKDMAPGMVEIKTSAIGRVASLEELKQKASMLLNSKGKENFESLRDDSRSQDLAEGLLLMQEFKQQKFDKQIQEVVFTYKNYTIMVNRKNIDSIFNRLLNSKKDSNTPPNEYEANQNIAEECLDWLDK